MPERSDFWSRRRDRVAREEHAAEKARLRDEAAREQAAFEAQEDETILQALGLPDPETLTPKDAAAFMARAVPARLRRRAMRALFRAHPGLSIPDGLQDYDDDYTVAPPDLRPVVAKWEPVIRDAAERAGAALRRHDAEDGEAFGPSDPALGEEEPAEQVDDIPVAVNDDDDAPLPRPRRMVFHVNGGTA